MSNVNCFIRLLARAVIASAVVGALAAPVWAQGAPFQFQADLALVPGPPNSVAAPIPVPFGMRLVIETVTARVGVVSAPREPHVSIHTVLDGAEVQHEIELSKVMETGALKVWTATQDVRLYTDAGPGAREASVQPLVRLSRGFGALGTLSGRVTISGTLVPVD